MLHHEISHKGRCKFMTMHKGFSMERARHANVDTLTISRQEYRISDRFSDEDIERAWRKAYEKAGEFIMPEERK